jgi:hypothetical protein
MSTSENRATSTVTNDPISSVRMRWSLHHLFWKLAANAPDQVVTDEAHRIELMTRADASVSVGDAGEGFPTEKSLNGMPFVEDVCTREHETSNSDGNAPNCKSDAWSGARARLCRFEARGAGEVRAGLYRPLLGSLRA